MPSQFPCVYKWYKQPLKASQKPQAVQSNLFSPELPSLKQYFSDEGVCQTASKAGLRYLGGDAAKIQVSVKFKLIQGMSASALHVFSPRKTLGFSHCWDQTAGWKCRCVNILHSVSSEALRIPLSKHEVWNVRLCCTDTIQAGPQRRKEQEKQIN